MIYIPEVPKTLHSQRERGRLQAQGHRTDDDTRCTLLVVHETDGSWAIHGLGAPGVRPSRDAMVTVGPDPGACPVSAPHCIHLLAADSGVACHRYGTHIAVCGELLTASSLPADPCSDDCDRMVAYCSDCLREAAEVNADAGVASIMPGAVLMIDQPEQDARVTR